MKLLTFPTWNWTWAYEKTGYDNTNLFFFEFQNILYFLYIMIVGSNRWQQNSSRITIVTIIPIRKVGKYLNSINNLVLSCYLFKNNFMLLLNFTTLFKNLLWCCCIIKADNYVMITYLKWLWIPCNYCVLCFYLQRA